VVLDRATGELVERTTAYAYGAVESDLRPGRWDEFREDHRFTGKEDDVEVGLIYFGARYLNPLLGRWISADPLAVHAPGRGDLNLYAYVHGRVLVAVDPVGLDEAPKAVNPNPQFVVTESTPVGHPDAQVWVAVMPGSPAHRAGAKPALYSSMGEAKAAAQQIEGAIVFANPTNMHRALIDRLTSSWAGAVGNAGTAAGPAGKSATSTCAGSDCLGGGSMPAYSAMDKAVMAVAMATGAGGGDRSGGTTGGVAGGHGPQGNAGPAGQAAWAAVQLVGHKVGAAVAKLAMSGGSLASAAVVVAIRGATRGVPNPFGKAGGLAHQAAVKDIASDIRSRGLEAVFEHRVATPGGAKASRYVDVVGKDSQGNVVEMHQVGRKTQRGQPVSREVKALDDIEHAAGARPTFHPYKP
jgi:RHS repeat-associated protein